MKPCLINGKWEIILPDFRADRPEWPWWEMERLQSMYETTKPGDVVYYVGAESGDMAGLLSMWGADLVLFEPNEKAWPQIKAVWDANNLKLPLGTFLGFASDKNSNLDKSNMYERGVWPDCVNGPIVPDHGFKELKDPADIAQLKIDDACETPPDMISLDVEGAEGRVLRGAEQTLRKYHPKIYLSLHHEFLHQGYGELHFDLCNWIKSLGYKETILGNQPHEAHILYERA